MADYHFTDSQNSRIEKQSLFALEKAFRQIVDIEVELQSRLDIIISIKARILIEIEVKVNMKK